MSIYSGKNKGDLKPSSQESNNQAENKPLYADVAKKSLLEKLPSLLANKNETSSGSSSTSDLKNTQNENQQTEIEAKETETLDQKKLDETLTDEEKIQKVSKENTEAELEDKNLESIEEENLDEVDDKEKKIIENNENNEEVKKEENEIIVNDDHLESSTIKKNTTHETDLSKEVSEDNKKEVVTEVFGNVGDKVLVNQEVVLNNKNSEVIKSKTDDELSKKPEEEIKIDNITLNEKLPSENKENLEEKINKPNTIGSDEIKKENIELDKDNIIEEKITETETESKEEGDKILPEVKVEEKIDLVDEKTEKIAEISENIDDKVNDKDNGGSGGGESIGDGKKEDEGLGALSITFIVIGVVVAVGALVGFGIWGMSTGSKL